MDEKRLDRMEDMLTTLIKMVGSQNEKINHLSQGQTSMKEEMASIKEEMASIKGETASIRGETASIKGEMASIKGEMASMKSENAKKFAEILDKLADMQADQDHIWKKAASNERELEKLKIRIGL